MQILLTIPAPKSKAIKYALYHAIITALLLFLQYNRQNIFFFAAALIPAWIFTLGFVCMSDLLYLLAPRVQCIAWSAYVHSIRCTLWHPIVRWAMYIPFFSPLASTPALHEQIATQVLKIHCVSEKGSGLSIWASVLSFTFCLFGPFDWKLCTVLE